MRLASRLHETVIAAINPMTTIKLQACCFNHTDHHRSKPTRSRAAPNKFQFKATNQAPTPIIMPFSDRSVTTGTHADPKREEETHIWKPTANQHHALEKPSSDSIHHTLTRQDAIISAGAPPDEEEKTFAKTLELL